MKIGKFNLQKKYRVFFLAVTLLMTSAFVGLPCPVCDGDGIISSYRTDEVDIDKLDFRETSSYIDACANFKMYLFHVDVTLNNSSEVFSSQGQMAFILVHSKTGQKLSTSYGKFELEPLETGTFSFDLSFPVTATIDESDATYILGKVLTGDVPDDACNGTGRVSLNEFLVKKAMSESYIYAQASKVPYIKPFEEMKEDTGVEYFFSDGSDQKDKYNSTYNDSGVDPDTGEIIIHW